VIRSSSTARLRAIVRAAAVAATLGAAVIACGTGDGSLELAGGTDGADAVRTGPDGATIDGAGSVDGSGDTGDTAGPVRPVVDIPDEWPSEIEALYGRYWLYWEAFAAAHGPPEADPTYAPLAALSTPANWTSLQGQLSSFADDGLVLELPPGSISEHLLRLPDAAVLTGDEGEEVVLQDCWIDDFVQRTVDGDVVAEANEAKLMNVVMRVVDGEWRVDGVTRASAASDGIEQCAALISG
jgi:hypothetical protein